MALNPDNGSQIPLTVFAGLVTYEDPVSLAAGASPDCSDMQFQPGGTSSRPGLQKVFNPSFGAVTLTYAKSYVDPSGVIRNLYLDSAGNLWVEDVEAFPGEYGLLANVTPGSYAKSLTANGREYFAFSDGIHGTDVPLQLTVAYPGNNPTLQIDRVTQDGPGSPPTIISLALPAVGTPSSVTPPATLTITGIFPDQRIGGGSGPFSTLNIYVSASPLSAPVGVTVTISGTGTGFDGTTAPVVLNPGPGGAITVSVSFPNGTPPYVGGGTLTIGTGVPNVVLKRVSNVVTALTATPHQLQPGYQAQLAGFLPGVVGGVISSIVINNEQTPGIATVTTSTPHGLVPQLNVSLTGIIGTAVGGTISSIVCAGEVVTVIMTTATGLTPGAIVTIDSATASFNTTVPVLNVTITTVAGDTFTYAFASAAATGSAGGTVTLNWPIPDTPTPSYFEVQSAPTATTFQISINYPDGSWSGGLVNYAWDITAYVSTVPTATSFTYQQYGPDATIVHASSQTITPFGQAAPGFKQMQVLFLTRNGAIPAPSPPVQFVANGGQYYSVSNIPIGPPNVIARILAFTESDGAYFFYIPDPPQVNGVLVGTATQIDDNVTQSVILDFGDPTLAAALGISIQGNNLANLIVLDGALGFGYYGSRLFTYGQRNIVDNFLNMGFDGGYLPSFATFPTGWTQGFPLSTNPETTISVAITSTTATTIHLTSASVIANGNTILIDSEASVVVSGGGTTTLIVTRGVNTIAAVHAAGATVSISTAFLAPGHFGVAWEIEVQSTGTAWGMIEQSAYEDYSGAPILQGNTRYEFRAWFKPSIATTGSNLQFFAIIASIGTGFTSTAAFTGSQMSTSGSYLQTPFNITMPDTIPPDMTLTIYAQLGTGETVNLLVDEMNVIYVQNPYLTGMFASYVNNPEGFDGVSGVIGPQNDTHPVFDLGIIRNNLCILTQDPSGRLHETSQGITEPADWIVDQVAANCGTVSAFSAVKSQADDASAAGGEEWWAWYSSTGIRIFGGQAPDKISQEIQRPKGQIFPGAPPDLGSLNPAAQLTVWGLNDPAEKVMYFGIPSGTAAAPNVIYVLSYLGLDSAAEISNNPPIHKSLSGKLVATDLGRKWCPWQLPMNGGALMYREAGVLQPVFFGGSGTTPGISFGTVNTASALTDTIVTWVSGIQFGGFDVLDTVIINGVNALVLSIISPTSMVVSGLLGTQTGVSYTAFQFGNVYILNPSYLTDDDYGLISSYYTTYRFPDRDTEQQEKLGGGEKMNTYMQSLVSGTGFMQFSVFINTLATLVVNAVQWSPRNCGPRDYLLQASPTANAEWAAMQATGQGFFYRFASTPNPAGTTAHPTTDNGFAISILVVGMKQNARYKIRGRYP